MRYYFKMNSQERSRTTSTLIAAERAHRRASGKGLGDIAISIQVRSCNALLQERLLRMLEPHGISNVGYYTLMALYSRPENLINPSELCAITGETRGNMTRICDELVDKGWIHRVPNAHDRRRVDLSLSEAGAALLKVVAPEMRKNADKFYKSLFTSAEKATLQALLARLAEGFAAQS